MNMTRASGKSNPSVDVFPQRSGRAPGQEYHLQVALRLCAEQVSKRQGHTGYEEYTFSVVYKSILKWLQADQAFQGPGLGLVSQPYVMNFIYLSYKGKKP